MHDGAVRKEGRNFGRTNLDGLLNNEIHVFAFWDYLGKTDPTTQRHRFCFVQFS